MESGEYRTDVAYARTFDSDLGPPSLRLVAALNGFSPPAAAGFDYCEIGCGTGDTIVALAAAHPGSRFVGVDLSAEHVAFARGLAARGGVENVRFLQQDFEDIDPASLPAFDFLCGHGLLSWISAEKRRAFVDFAGAMLAPGGLLYVGYNALPGWAAIAPLRRLMQESAASAPGASSSALDRARHALATAKLLDAAGASYFAHNPTARVMLEKMARTGLPYVVHEYLQPHWHPMYFADVAREMEACGLHFIGALPAYLNYRDLALPPALAARIADSADRLAYETLRDYALNEFFRRDVYLKGTRGRDDRTTERYLDETPFTAVEGPIQREAALPHATLQLTGALFDALSDALSTEALTIPELARRPALAGFDAAKLRASVLHLVVTGQVSPVTMGETPLYASVPAQPVTIPRKAPSPAGTGERRLCVPLAYNRMILGQPLANDSPIVLASELAGTGISVTMLDAVSIRALTEATVGERPAWIHAFVASHPLALHAGGRRIEGAEEKARVLEDAIEGFRAEKLPRLLRLGVLEEG